MQPVLHGFHGNTARLNRNHPMQLGQGQIFPEGNIQQVSIFQNLPSLVHVFAFSKQIGDQLILGKVIFFIFFREIGAVSHKIQPADAQALFIKALVIQRVVFHHRRHANDCMVALHFRQAVKPQGKIPGSNGNFVPIGPLIVQSPAHIEVFRFVSGSSTHKKASLPFFG